MLHPDPFLPLKIYASSYSSSSDALYITAYVEEEYEMTYTLEDLPPTPTPKDYSRIQFDPSQLPKERIVGILACQRMSPSHRENHLESVLITRRSTPPAPPDQNHLSRESQDHRSPTPERQEQDKTSSD
jgi:hypothetical protein